VRIKQAGPFDFMVDIGSQVTVIDPSLASQLDLRPQGRIGLVSVASFAQVSTTVLDSWKPTLRWSRNHPRLSRTLDRFKNELPFYGTAGPFGLSLLRRKQPILLQLDSSIDGPILYPGSG
jgi:hypothetical protein